MAVAARIPQASTPSDTIAIFGELYADGQELQFTINRPFSFLDEAGIEDELISIGTTTQVSVESEIGVTDSLFHFYLHNIEFLDSIDIDTYQNYTEQLTPIVAAVVIDQGDAVGRLDSLELELTLLSVNPLFFKEFNYSSSSLLGYTLYIDSTKQVELLTVQFEYSGEDLMRKTIHRVQDNKTLIIDFNYSAGNLISQVRSMQ